MSSSEMDSEPLITKKKEKFSSTLKDSLDDSSKGLTAFNYSSFVLVNLATCGLTTLALFSIHKYENRKCVEYI